MKTRGHIVLALLVSLTSSTARADSDDNELAARAHLQAVTRDLPAVQRAIERTKAERPRAEQRIATGDLLLRTKDYSRAVVVFSEVLEQFPNTPAYVDALWLRGEAFYASKEYLSAKRDYRGVIARGDESRFRPYLPKALGRMIDISFRLSDPPEALDEVFEKFSRLPADLMSPALRYAKGKGHYRRKEYSAAEQELRLAAQAPGSEYAHQARYFLGLVTLRQTPAAASATDKPNYRLAIDTFKQVTDLPPDTPEHRHVIDLAWMAIGRLFHELDQYQQASDAYSRIGRESPTFDTMLYELAWVYVRMGDPLRAERALEVLAVSDPGSPYIADGTLLRADLLLRAGAFDKALQLYEGIRNQYDPIRSKVEAFLGTTHDPSVYYEKLSQQQLDVLDQADQLPPIAVRWARDAQDGALAFAVIDDVNQCRTLIRQSHLLIEKLTALASSASRVRAFHELQAGEENALGLINRLASARHEVARGLDDEESGVSGELADVREKRRKLMAQIGALPVHSGDFNAREASGARQWNKVSQELTLRAQEIDVLQATINGLRRVLKEDAQRGVARDPATLDRFNREIDANERDIKRMRERAAEIRRLIEMGRAQVGLGDARYQHDALARREFSELLRREVELVAGGGAGSGAAKFAAKVQPILREADAYEEQLVATFRTLEGQVEQRTRELREKIETEKRNIEGYEVQLEGLDTEARELVGRVAERNFGLVRDKLRNLVLRADVGITEQAWEVREEELGRVRTLQSERARQETLLDEELREVRDDGGK
jgi:tetratricopeptide (TPR) repeat protein